MTFASTSASFTGHTTSSSGQQALACFKKNKKDHAVEILQAGQAGVPQPCRDADGSRGKATQAVTGS